MQPTPPHPSRSTKKFIKPFLDTGLNETHSTYLAMIENIDYNLGRLMRFLKDSNLEQNTILIIINDNGVTEGLDIYNANMRGPNALHGKEVRVHIRFGDGLKMKPKIIKI